MTLKLRLLVRVVQRRVGAGEALEVVLKDYPKLTEHEKTTVLACVKNVNNE